MMNADENISLMILSVLIACSVMLLKIAGISPIKILYHCIKTMTYLVVLSILVILMYFTGLHLGSMLNIDPLVTKVGVICLILIELRIGLRKSKRDNNVQTNNAETKRH